MADLILYPKPFFTRLCGPPGKFACGRAFLLFCALYIFGFLVDTFLSIHRQIPLSFAFLGVYCGLISIGALAICHVFFQTKDSLEELGLVEQLRQCLNKIYSTKPMMLCGFVFALCITFIQIALQFNVSNLISVYFSMWNLLAGFVVGLGFWTACGSLQLGSAISKCNLTVFLLAPFQTPIIRKLSILMWSYSLWFTLEVLLFSTAVTMAATEMNSLAKPLFGKFTGLDIAGGLSFFFLMIFTPLYTLSLQEKVVSAVRRSKCAALANLDVKLREALENLKSSDREKLSDLLDTNKTIRDSSELPFALENVTKLLTLLIPALALVYGKNSALIDQLGKSLLKAFLPSVNP